MPDAFRYCFRFCCDPGFNDEIELPKLLSFCEEARVDDVMVFVNVEEINERWRDLAARGGTRAALLDFHARHKLLLAAQAPVLARALEALLARMGNTRLEAVFDRYGALLARALAAAPPGVKERPRGST